MTSKKPEDLLAELDNLGAQAAARTSKSSTRAPRHGQAAQSSQTEQDLLAELGSLAQRPASRPGTPSLKPNAATAGSRSPMRGTTATPPPGRSSEEKSSSGGQRKSGDSTRSLHQTFTPATTATEESPEPTPPAAPARSGGWWGGIVSTATAAVSQAQAAVREIQKNEEAQRYLEQVKGNVGALRGFGMTLPRALRRGRC
jgi:Family of unknown function (DUF5427)